MGDRTQTEQPSLQDLATLVAEARQHPDRRMTIAQAAEAAEVSVMTWRKVEIEGQPARTATYRAIERALGWPNRAISRFLDEGITPGEDEHRRTLEELSEARDTISILRAELDELRRTAVPTVQEASWSELLDEIDRRHRSATGESPVRPGVVETAESVRRRGGEPGRPMRERTAGESWQDSGPSGVTGQS